MLAESNCWKRNCKHYLGILQPDGTEMTEVQYCTAFPKGIPDDIAYGKNQHLKPVKGDNGIQFEKGEPRDWLNENE